MKRVAGKKAVAIKAASKKATAKKSIAKKAAAKRTAVKKAAPGRSQIGTYLFCNVHGIRYPRGESCPRCP
jgi:hypothetical protein